MRVPAAKPLLPAPPYDTRQATLDNGRLTVDLKIPRTSPGPKPAVIALAGEEDALLAAGIVVVTYTYAWEQVAVKAPAPPPAAGTRTYGTWMLASPTPQKVGAGYFAIIATSAGFIPKIIDYLDTLPEIDPTRIGMAGTSTRGFMTLEAVALDARIRVAVAVTACGDYLCFLHLSSLGMKGEPLDLDPTYERDLVAREAISDPQRLTHTALLMLNGSQDLAVPAECARRTDAVLRKAYAAAGVPDRYRFVLREGASHNIIARTVREDMIPWFQRWFAAENR